MLDKEKLRADALLIPKIPGLTALLSAHSPLLFYVGELERQILSFQLRLGSENLASDEGRFRAIRLQGQIAGLKLASETLFDLADGEQGPTQEKSNA